MGFKELEALHLSLGSVIFNHVTMLLQKHIYKTRVIIPRKTWQLNEITVDPWGRGFRGPSPSLQVENLCLTFDSPQTCLHFSLSIHRGLVPGSPVGTKIHRSKRLFWSEVGLICGCKTWGMQRGHCVFIEKNPPTSGHIQFKTVLYCSRVNCIWNYLYHIWIILYV